MTDKIKGRAKGGHARAKNLTNEKKQEIAKRAALARWGAKATHKGNFKEEFGIDVECYVLDDDQKTAVISQTGMGDALGFSKGGSRFPRFIEGKKITSHVGPELSNRLGKPLIFQGLAAGPNVPRPISYGYDVTMLIDICKVIIKAETEGSLPSTHNAVRQAHIILGASAKAGIKGLVYALSGYNPSTEEVIAAFKLYVSEEAKKYEPEFPNELYMQWHRLYNLAIPTRGKPWQFKFLTVNHIYFPLAKSNGKLLSLLKILKAKDGNRQTKLFQFLNEIGARALRIQLGRVLEMAESSVNSSEYEKKINTRFGDQKELDLVISHSASDS